MINSLMLTSNTKLLVSLNINANNRMQTQLSQLKEYKTTFYKKLKFKESYGKLRHMAKNHPKE